MPPYVLVVDTETTIDVSQRLLYGGYVFARVTPTGLVRLEEGLIYADDLGEFDPDGLATLWQYAAGHPADVDRADRGSNWGLQLRSRSDFMERLVWRAVYKGRATLVMFNAPFDLSRLALGAGEARKAYAGGFSLKMFEPERFRPRIAVKSLDSKRALKGFTAPAGVDAEDTLDLDDEQTMFRGHLLDLRTLVFALTNSGHTLASACEAFGVEHGKLAAPEHGTITPEHVDYCRRDVLATAELYEKVIAEYDRHPIDVQPTRVFSPATIAKGYLRAMGVRPVLDRQPDFPDDVLGAAMSAFYGGRAEVHHRLEPLPVQLVDFTSMYPTVVNLLGLWGLLTAERVEPVDANDDVRELLAGLTVDGALDPGLWPQLVGIAQIVPDGDILPVRAEYGPEPGYTIGVNHFYDEQPHWYALPDLASSALLTGRAPKIIRAIRFAPLGTQEGLQQVALRGEYLIDPSRDDPFTTAVDMRQRRKATGPKNHPDPCACPDCQDLNFLKVFANSGAYGIFAEIIRHELGGRDTEIVTVHAGTDQPWTAAVHNPEDPGEYCFPPIACCITAAARLMLAILERLVTDAGGTWVFCDTDSMAIVTQPADQLPATGLGLTHAVVTSILDRFATLNPYAPDAVSGSILRREKRGAGHCLAVSAKRYMIYDDAALTEHAKRKSASMIGSSPVLKRSEHGLGHLLNPTSPNDDASADWIDELWIWIFSVRYGLPADEPAWLDLPALSRIGATTAAALRPFRLLNEGRDWQAQVKPFNFLLAAHTLRLDRPVDCVDQFQLIAPYSRDPDDWTSLPWVNRYAPNGATYTITTADETDDDARLVRVQTYRDVAMAYMRHPEAKFQDNAGTPCGPDTTGPLARRHVQPARIYYIGKEADQLDDLAAGITHNLTDAVTHYTRRQDWADAVQPYLDQATTQEIVERILLAHPGLATPSAITRAIQRARTGRLTREPLRSVLLTLATEPR